MGSPLPGAEWERPGDFLAQGRSGNEEFYLPELAISVSIIAAARKIKAK